MGEKKKKEKGQRRPRNQKACKLDCPFHDSHSRTVKCDLIFSLEHLVLDDGTSISLDAEDPYHINYSQPRRNSSSEPKNQERTPIKI